MRTQYDSLTICSCGRALQASLNKMDQSGWPAIQDCMCGKSGEDLRRDLEEGEGAEVNV